MFLRLASESQPTRYGHGSGADLAVLASVGFYGVVALVVSIPGVFGQFGGEDEARANISSIRRLSDCHDVVKQFVLEYPSNTNGKFFFVVNELPALNAAVQAELVSTQIRCWTIIQEQFDLFDDDKFHVLRDCI